MREFIHQVQNLRKEADLELTDRIRLYVKASSSQVRQALQAYREAILAEVLGVEVVEGVPEGVPTTTFTLDGGEVTVGLEKVHY